ncbi:7502_t:CDS:1 [Paraglomus brasilianum]|uniref:7502_t:CDS:1 n=1 Tax=Paraglomus brasilianum TaxID=144538 RepID=A0A9N8YWX2_9GLOM|nr:7502_t:CDS:1 [Paraglomus brasilianum]
MSTIQKITTYPPPYWSISNASGGIQVNPADNYLNYKVVNAQQSNEWAFVSVLNNLSTKAGAFIIFRIRVNAIQNAFEAKLSLCPYGESGATGPPPRGVILRYFAGSFNYQWYDTSGNFQQLSASNIRDDGAWHTIVMGLNPQSVTLLENSSYKFTWNVNVPDIVNPTFDMAISDVGSSLDIDIGDVLVIPSKVDDNISD